MFVRNQQTLQKEVRLAGVGFLTGADVSVHLLPADENHGVVFERVDLPGRPRVAARIENAVCGQRRTVLKQDGVTVMLVEHVLAALAGLWVDNCLVQVDGPEPPGLDGSARPVVEAILEAGVCRQSAAKPCLRLSTLCQVGHENGAWVLAGSTEACLRSEDAPLPEPLRKALLAAAETCCSTDAATGEPSQPPGDVLVLGYQLDYGPDAPIPPHVFATRLDPQTFVRELAFARTFVLESEVAALRARGFGRRLTPKDLLVVGTNGRIIGNRLRADDEFARHKLLDCVGDLALTGADLTGAVVGVRSGHELNHELARRLVATQDDEGRRTAA